MAFNECFKIYSIFSVISFMKYCKSCIEFCFFLRICRFIKAVALPRQTISPSVVVRAQVAPHRSLTSKVFEWASAAAEAVQPSVAVRARSAMYAALPIPGGVGAQSRLCTSRKSKGKGKGKDKGICKTKVKSEAIGLSCISGISGSKGKVKGKATGISSMSGTSGKVKPVLVMNRGSVTSRASDRTKRYWLQQGATREVALEHAREAYLVAARAFDAGEVPSLD